MIIKDKKIACFVALPHHTRFLWPITESLEENGAKLLFFTATSDFPFEGDLIKKGKQCKIIQEYVTQNIAEKIGRGTRDFFELWFKRCFQWDGLRHWPLVQQASLLTVGFEEYFCLEELIKTEKPDMFLALHERNRWGKIIGHLSSKHGIPYVTLQEGDYYEDRLSFSGHTEYSTALLLWGNGIKERLARMKSTPEKFVLNGNTHLSAIKRSHFKPTHIAATKKELNIPPGKKVVLFLVGIQWGVLKDDFVWKELLAGIGDDVVKIFKWHPKVTYSGFKENVENLFKKLFPSCIVLHNYDPYSLLPIADYCVTLGKTTLAVEGLSFGKPLFSLPGTDGEIDHYAKAGVSQPLWPPGNYDPLYKTIREGVPETIRVNVENYLNNDYFYKNNTIAVERAVEAVEHIFKSRCNEKKAEYISIKKDFAASRISYVIPSGYDADALLATLTSLSQSVKSSDWEVVIVVHDSAINEMLSGISGDVRIVESKGNNLALLYNKGAEASSGEYLIFLKPGVLYYKDEGLLEAVKKGVAGIPIKNKDNTPYCFGIGFDFNHVPYRIQEMQETDKQIAVGGGLLGVSREHFETIGGFDVGIAAHLLDADICLSAIEAGLPVIYLKDCLGFVFKETFVQKSEEEEITTDSDDEWKRRIGFFAKWVGKLPKDDDYISFAGELLKV